MPTWIKQGWALPRRCDLRRQFLQCILVRMNFLLEGDKRLYTCNSRSIGSYFSSERYPRDVQRESRGAILKNFYRPWEQQYQPSLVARWTLCCY
jgi:hypothetical protein